MKGGVVSERLDIIPTQFRVIATRRPKYVCRSCEGGITQAPAPAHIITGGMLTEASGSFDPGRMGGQIGVRIDPGL